MDLRVELGRRPSLLGGPPRGPRTVRLARPIVVDLDGLLGSLRVARIRTRRLETTWSATDGPAGLESALERLGEAAVTAARAGTEVLILSDRSSGAAALPIPSILAVGSVHSALTTAGLRGRMDLLVEASDILDVHSMAMVIAIGATAVHPWLAVELAAELAGTRGAEELTAAETIDRLALAFEAGLRKTLARMGISAVSSYVGGALVDVVDLDASVIARVLSDGRRLAWPHDPRRSRGPSASKARRRDRLARTGARPRGAPARPGVRPLPWRWRGPSLLAEDRWGDPGARDDRDR